MLWFVTIAAIILALAIIVLKCMHSCERKIAGGSKKLTFIQEHILTDYMMQFIIGLTATIIGVTLAILLTNADNIKNDKNNTVAYITKVQEENEKLLREFDEIFLSRFEAFDEGIVDEDYLVNFVTGYFPKPLTSLEGILHIEAVLKTMNPQIYVKILEIIQEYTSNREDIVSDEIDVYSVALDYQILRSYCLYANNLLSLQKSLLVGEVKENEVDTKMAEYAKIHIHDVLAAMGLSEEEMLPFFENGVPFALVIHK